MVGRLRSHARRNLVAYLALVVALAATGGAAYSAIPDANSVIHACYDNAGGTLRVIDTDAAGVCRPTETALDWNQKGQPGVAGAQGAQGPQGPPGVGTTYGKSALGPVELPKPGLRKTVVTLTVPRGSYVITGKAVGQTFVPKMSFDGCLDDLQSFEGIKKIIGCNSEYNRRNLGATIFECSVSAGASRDLGRANLIAGVRQFYAFQTVSANVLHTFEGSSNKITLSCVQYPEARWPAKITHARLIAMKVDQINPLNAFRTRSIKIPRAKKPKTRVLP